VESLLADAEVSSPRPEYHFERAITLIRPLDLTQNLQEFPDTVFLGVDVESLLGDAEVSSPATRVPVRKGHNF